MRKWVLLMLLLWEFSSIEMSDNQGRIRRSSVVVGGKPARPQKFRMAARLGHHIPAQNETKWFCGGTLISQSVVLTAAHCFYSEVGTVNVVRLGELVFDSDKDDAEPEDFEVLELKTHPNFQFPVLYNDIGLVRLVRKVTFSNYKLPACLPLNDGSQVEYFTAIGWGQTKYNKFEPSQELMEVQLQNFGQSCRQTIESNEDLPKGYNAESQLCVGSREHEDTCNGDSGGPLLISLSGNGCNFTVMGITSVGIACDTPDFPSLYTRVHFFRDWIKAELAKM
ncbi:serine protease snake-like [Drosophila ficusphila]|uniref:serine protease snake-like n=1 Tax=Drosophila ficusphila TaxID=30025 RepID=UPI0007E5D90C|nr:serine protease snake-like [Drosophila ficusphila]